MKFAVFSILVLLPFLARADEKYTSKYDNVDIDQVLQSDRLLSNYMNCILDKGKCTPDAAELRRVLPDALENGCAKCTDKQREGSTKVLQFLVDHKPDLWKQLEAKYDPQHKYIVKYKAEANLKNIHI